MGLPKLHLVFFHEIGHYVAHELNHTVFAKGLGVWRIRLQKPSDHNGNYFTGETIPIKPDGYKLTDPINFLPGYMAVLLYGCLFETLYSKHKESTVGFLDCFKYYSSGHRDLSAFEALNELCDFDVRQKIVRLTQEEHMTRLLHEDYFMGLFNLEPMAFLRESGLYWEMDITHLKTQMPQFLSSHEDHYKDYVTTIASILTDAQN